MGRDDNQRAPGRAFRGLFIVFAFSFINLVGLIVVMTGLGGVEPWSRWEFIGLFGVLEAASGLANVVSPNIWRLPVAELKTSGRTDVTFAASAMWLPHWGGLARFAAGLICIGAAAWANGLGPATLGLVPLLLALACAILAISAIVARAGVARPDLDVFELAVRWRRREKQFPPVSIGAAAFQFVLSIVTVPAVLLLPPSVLYQPEPGPSAQALLVTFAATAVLVLLAYLVWWGRIQSQAPSEQQREAEEHA